MSNKEKTFGGKMVDAALAGIPGLIGMGIGAIGQRKRDARQDKRQLAQQQKLMNMQIQGQMSMADYMNKKQMELWNQTNYGAQVEHLKEAGLNPALMYGMGGGGGATAAASGGSVTGGQATVNNGEIAAMAGMGIQASMTKAQIELIKAQTQKTEAEAAKTAGVDTALAQSQINSLNQGVENQKAQKELTEIQTDIGRIEEYVKSKTQNAAVAIIMTELREATARMNIMENEKLISDETRDEKIKIIESELVGMGLRNILTKAGITKTEAEIKQIYANIDKISQELAMGWQSLSLDERNTKVAEMLGEWNTSLTKEGLSAITSIVGELIQGRTGRGIKKGANSFKK